MTDRQTNSWDARDPGVHHDVHVAATRLGRTPAVDDVLTVEVDGRWRSGRR